VSGQQYDAPNQEVVRQSTPEPTLEPEPEPTPEPEPVENPPEDAPKAHGHHSKAKGDKEAA
jgi:hypothetical protein